MLIVIRCTSCGKTLADKYDYYIEQVNKLMAASEAPVEPSSKTKAAKPAKKKAAVPADEAGPSKPIAQVGGMAKHFDKIQTGAIMDQMGLTRYCCRRHMLGTVDMMDTI